MTNKIIRSICVFTKTPNDSDKQKLDSIASKLESKGYIIQTKRMSSDLNGLSGLIGMSEKGIEYTSIGDTRIEDLDKVLPSFYGNKTLSFNMELSDSYISQSHVAVLQDIIRNKPSKTFGFTYTFNNAASSPFFPSATFEQEGFAIGLQPTNLSVGCDSVEEWLEKLESAWGEIYELFKDDEEFLGIDSSIAPLFEGDSSFINFLHRIGETFEHSVTTNVYTKITKFIKEKNPKPIGLCGMMLPCTEDFELTDEYEAGKFSIERNIYLSLHSGLGIDTYPIGVNENPERILEILQLLQSLSNKYMKPLSARFVSDGKAKIGDRADFQDQYLKDCIVRPL